MDIDYDQCKEAALRQMPPEFREDYNTVAAVLTDFPEALEALKRLART